MAVQGWQIKRADSNFACRRSLEAVDCRCWLMIQLPAASGNDLGIVGAKSEMTGLWAFAASPAKKDDGFWVVSSESLQAYWPKATSETSFVVSE